MDKKLIILLIISVLLSPQYLFARYQVELTPSVSLEEQYDDNITLEPTNKQSDWITTLSPSLNLGIVSQKNNFSINYTPSIVRYMHKASNKSYTIRHNGSFSFSESLSQHLGFDMSDTYIRSDDPIEQTEGIIGVRRTRKTYQRNDGRAGISYSFGTGDSFLLGYRHRWLDNKDISLVNGTIFDPYANFTYWFNIKHGLELSTGYTKANFKRGGSTLTDNDFSGFNQGVGYRYRINPSTTASVDYGFTNRNFKGSSNDYKVHEASFGISHSLSEDMLYSFSAGYFGYKKDLRNDNGLIFGISFTKRINRGSLNFSGTSGWNEAYLESEIRGFTKYQQLSSNFSYKVTEKLSSYASLSYRQDKDETGRKSKTIGVDYGWDWAFLRYYSMSLDYSISTRNDDLTTENYMVNRVNLTFKWSKPYR